MGEDLKPCPFCGGDASIYVDRDLTPRHGTQVHDVTMWAECTAGCVTYHNIIGDSSTLEADRETTAELWNTRASQWISVSDRLPEEFISVLLCHRHGGVIVAQLHHGVWYDSANSMMGDGWTHWMPLPAAPKGDNDV
jgi:hypothetical protein